MHVVSGGVPPANCLAHSLQLSFGGRADCYLAHEVLGLAIRPYSDSQIRHQGVWSLGSVKVIDSSFDSCSRDI